MTNSVKLATVHWPQDQRLEDYRREVAERQENLHRLSSELTAAKLHLCDAEMELHRLKARVKQLAQAQREAEVLYREASLDFIRTELAVDDAGIEEGRAA